MKIIYNLILLFICVNCFGQVTEEWCTYPSFRSYGRDVVIDYRHNKAIYVGAILDYSPSSDFVVFKYDSNGVVQWTMIYNDSVWANAECHGIELDTLGNVYAAGMLSDPSSGQWDIFTIKLDSSGNTLWTNRFNGSLDSSDYTYDLKVTANGDVYVAGYTNGPSYSKDLLLIKYNSAGQLQWINQINGNANRSDACTKISEDSRGNIVALGYITDSLQVVSLFITKFDTSGNIVWDKRYSGQWNSGSFPGDMAIDDSDNIYIACRVTHPSLGGDYTVIKYDSAGTLLWEYASNITSGYLEANAITIDRQGSIYSTGTYDCGAGCSWNVITVKLNSAGTEQWAVTYDDSDNNSDRGQDIAADDSGNVFVLGTTPNANFTHMTLLEYDSSGNFIGEIVDPGYGFGAVLLLDNNNELLGLGYSNRNVAWIHSMLIKYGDGINPTLVPEISEPSVTCYPNPSSGVFLLTGVAPIEKVHVYSSTGNLVDSKFENGLLDLSGQAAGIYFAEIILDDSSIRHIQLVVQ